MGSSQRSAVSLTEERGKDHDETTAQQAGIGSDPLCLCSAVFLCSLPFLVLHNYKTICDSKDKRLP